MKINVINFVNAVSMIASGCMSITTSPPPPHSIALVSAGTILIIANKAFRDRRPIAGTLVLLITLMAPIVLAMPLMSAHESNDQTTFLALALASATSVISFILYVWSERLERMRKQ